MHEYMHTPVANIELIDGSRVRFIAVTGGLGPRPGSSGGSTDSTRTTTPKKPDRAATSPSPDKPKTGSQSAGEKKSDAPGVQVIKQVTHDGGISTKDRAAISHVKNGNALLNTRASQLFSSIGNTISDKIRFDSKPAKSLAGTPALLNASPDKRAEYNSRVSELRGDKNTLDVLARDRHATEQYLQQMPKNHPGREDVLKTLDDLTNQIQDRASKELPVVNAARQKRALYGTVQAQLQQLEPQAAADRKRVEQIEKSLQYDVREFVRNGGQLPSDGGLFDDADWHPVKPGEDAWSKINEIRKSNEGQNLIDQLSDAGGEGQGDATGPAKAIQAKLKQYDELQSRIEGVAENKQKLQDQLSVIKASYDEDVAVLSPVNRKGLGIARTDTIEQAAAGVASGTAEPGRGAGSTEAGRNGGTSQPAIKNGLGATYTVKAGDNLTTITQRYMDAYNIKGNPYLQALEIAKQNKIANPDQIDVGQKVQYEWVPKPQAQQTSEDPSTVEGTIWGTVGW